MNSHILRPVLNPFTLLLQFFIIILFGGILVHGIRTYIVRPPDFMSLKILLPGIFIFLFFSYIVIGTVLNLIYAFKFVNFDSYEVKVFYPLRLKRVKFNRKEIRGFTTCRIRYNINSVILYTKTNELIEFTNKDIFGFERLSKYLEKNFIYLGEEDFSPKTWIGRNYKYKNE